MKYPVHDKECRDHHLDGMKNELDNGTERENERKYYFVISYFSSYSIYNEMNSLALFIFIFDLPYISI